jgi:hypothetical protein
LLEANVDVSGDLVFDANTQGDHAEIILDDRRVAAFGFQSFNVMTWDVRLHPSVAYELDFDSGSGSGDFDLISLQLTSLVIDLGSGSLRISLPPGDYRANLDMGSGSLTISLPADAAAQIEVESGSGSFSPSSNLALVSGEADDDGVWETANFNEASEQILISIDQGSGSIQVQTR